MNSRDKKKALFCLTDCLGLIFNLFKYEFIVFKFQI